MNRSLTLTGAEAAIINNALNWLVNGVPYSSTGMPVDEQAATRALRFFNAWQEGQPVGDELAGVASAALRRVLVLLDGDPELSTLIADEADVKALAQRLPGA